MTTLSATPMSVAVSAVTEPNLDVPHYTLRVQWQWPENQGVEWTRFCLVRRLNSPAAVREEGVVIFDEVPENWGRPEFEDFNAPPNRWVYYTAFVLTPDRVWVRVGDSYGVGTGDHDWALNLPESLPGVSVSNAQQVVAKADPDHQLVEFLQPPAMFLDRVISLGESAQFFWNPLRVPPPMLEAFLHTMGIDTFDNLSDARLRHVAKALIDHRPYGTLDSIFAFVEAVTGYDAHVRMSDNHMLSVLDSSFETVPDSLLIPDTSLFSYQDLLAEKARYSDIPPAYPTYGSIAVRSQSRTAYETSAWEPKDPDKIRVRRYVDFPNPAPTLPVEVLDEYFLHIEGPRTIKNGEPEFVGDTARAIPVSSWRMARGGLFARSALGADLSLSLDLYGPMGTYLRTVPLLSTQLDGDWTWYSTEYDAPVPLDGQDANNDPNFLTSAGSWKSLWPGAAVTQQPPTQDAAGSRFTWNTDPAPAGDIGNQPTRAIMTKQVTGLTPDVPVMFRWIMGPASDVTTGLESTPWRLIVLWGDQNHPNIERSAWSVVSPDEESFMVMEWIPPHDVSAAWFGIEVAGPDAVGDPYTYGTYPWQATYADTYHEVMTYNGLLASSWTGGWSVGAEHVAKKAEVIVTYPDRGTAYWAVPVLTVSDSADIDLICVDDG